MQHGEVTRTIKGPCVECESDDWPCSCSCHYSGIGDFSDPEQTMPAPKLDPETRPNVPPRMM